MDEGEIKRSKTPATEMPDAMDTAGQTNAERGKNAERKQQKGDSTAGKRPKAAHGWAAHKR